ncbi:hypothetical protein [Streptomyces sp. NPDC054849]
MTETIVDLRVIPDNRDGPLFLDATEFVSDQRKPIAHVRKDNGY